ncbi:hypothetical protein [Saccharothrix sp.]|nr:hypothetical protein [Saccharothrix sp.]
MSTYRIGQIVPSSNVTMEVVDHRALEIPDNLAVAAQGVHR